MFGVTSQVNHFCELEACTQKKRSRMLNLLKKRGIVVKDLTNRTCYVKFSFSLHQMSETSFVLDHTLDDKRKKHKLFQPNLGPGYTLP